MVLLLLEESAEGRREEAELAGDGLPGGGRDLAVDEAAAGLVARHGREEEREVLGHDAVRQARRQRRHDPEGRGEPDLF